MLKSTLENIHVPFAQRNYGLRLRQDCSRTHTGDDQANIEMENEKKENVAETIEVEVQGMSKGELIDSFTASAKLRRFKATEPEI